MAETRSETSGGIQPPSSAPKPASSACEVLQSENRKTGGGSEPWHEETERSTERLKGSCPCEDRQVGALEICSYADTLRRVALRWYVLKADEAQVMDR